LSQGKPAKSKPTAESLTGTVSQRRPEFYSRKRRIPNESQQILGASANNLKDVDITQPAGLRNGSYQAFRPGKSTLVNDTYRAPRDKNSNRSLPKRPPRKRKSRAGQIDKKSKSSGPDGALPRSNPATYTGVFHLTAISSRCSRITGSSAAPHGRSAST